MLLNVTTANANHPEYGSIGIKQRELHEVLNNPWALEHTGAVEMQVTYQLLDLGPKHEACNADDTIEACRKYVKLTEQILGEAPRYAEDNAIRRDLENL